MDAASFMEISGGDTCVEDFPGPFLQTSKYFWTSWHKKKRLVIEVTKT